MAVDMERQVDPNIVILPSSTWVRELSQEFKQDPAAVINGLRHILGRAGWPRETHRVADYVEPSEESRGLMEERPDGAQ